MFRHTLMIVAIASGAFAVTAPAHATRTSSTPGITAPANCNPSPVRGQRNFLCRTVPNPR